MVYVFGLDIPLVEVLLILLILLTAGLALIWFELNRMRRLLEMEKGVLNKFEKTLDDFEQREGQKHNQELLNYVEQALSRGASTNEIRTVLERRGWDTDTINDIIDSATSELME